MVNALNSKYNENRAKVTKYLGVANRKDALRGADFVVNAIQVGLYDPCTITDFEVPKKYGLRQTIGRHPRNRRYFQGAAHISGTSGFARTI
jgi:alpha-galactosidase